MARRFQFPEGTRRQFSLSLSVLVLLMGAGYAYYRVMPGAPSMPPIASETVQQFRNICVKQARHANGGGDLVMDDDTEAKIGAYCGCVTDGIVAKVPPTEITKIGDNTESDGTLKLLDAIVADCRAKLTNP